MHRAKKYPSQSTDSPNARLISGRQMAGLAAAADSEYPHRVQGCARVLLRFDVNSNRARAKVRFGAVSFLGRHDK